MTDNEALQKYISLTEGILESIHDGILVVSDNGTIIKTNANFTEMWRIPDAILSSADDKKLLDFIVEQLADPEGFIAKVSEVYAKPESESFDLIHFKDKRIFERISKPMIIGGKPKGRVWSYHDITERIHAEKALRESETIYRNLVSKLPDGVYKSTHEGKFLDVNPAMVSMLGYASKEELMSIDIKSQLYFEASDRESLVLQEKLEETGVYRLKKKDGSGIWVEDKGWYNLDEEGNILSHEGIMRDITERKHAEAEIQLINEELHRINAEKDKFFSIIAHDLRSPFNGFLGLTEIMAEELSTMTMEDIQKFAVIMRTSATNLYSLLGNLLEWSRMQRNLTTFVPLSFQLMQRISESMVYVLEGAVKKEISISYDIPENMEVYADTDMVGGIIRNLVSNAVKFTPKGGSIIISAKSAAHNLIEISIKDSGIGMNTNMIGHLFCLDVNTSRTGTEGEYSTGLGLIICKDFIEKHGGKLWVESEVGKGSTFRFTLPAKMKK